MKTLIYIIAILSIAFNSINSFAATVSGQVFGSGSDNKKTPLINAKVQWMGTDIGVMTNTQGRFEINKPPKSHMLIVGYIGYKSDTVHVHEPGEFIEIKLNADFELSEVVIEGNSSAFGLSRDAITKTENITGHGLRKAACCNLSETFETNPSVDVNYSDAVTGAKQIELLGLDGIYTQIMTEKMPDLRGIASAFGLTYIPGTWMESIQISKGAASVSTGYESITGQINVEYKKPLSSDPLFFNFFANQHGRLEANADASMEVAEGVGTALFLHGDIMRTQVDKNGDSFLDKPMLKNFNIMNRWELESESYHSNFGVKALYENRQGGQKDFYPDENMDLYGIGIKTERYEAYAKNGFRFEDGKSSIGLITTATSHNQNSFFGGNKYDANQKSVYANLIFESGFEAESNNEGGEVEPQGSLPHKYSLGLSYTFDEYDERFNGTIMFRKESVPGAFAEYTFSGIEDLAAVGGIRADFHNIYGTIITPRFHLKYEPGDDLTLRASAGKGSRITNILAENTGVLASSRKIIIEEELDMEEAWNYGLNLSYCTFLADRALTINAEYYRTDFNNQVIADIEQAADEAHFYNLRGESYSNSFQIDALYELFDNFEILLAYRLNDVQITMNDKLQQKPLQSKHKGFMNLAYWTEDNEWAFDFTVSYNGGGILPNTEANPTEYRLGEEFDSYFVLNGQISKEFDAFSVYLGGENLTNFKQENPILAYEDPFGIKYGKSYFDSSMIWGPILGRVIYAGVRIAFN